MRAPRIRSHLHFSALSYHLQIIHTDNIEKMTEGIRAQHPPASKLHNHVILRMIMTADLALLLSSSKSGRPTSLDVDQGQGTSSSVGHFPYFDQSRKKLEHLSTVKQQLLMPLPKLGTRQRPLSLTILDPLHLQPRILPNNINNKFTVTRKSCRPRKIGKIMFRNILIGR